jgi:hypothetical protein
VVQNSEVRKLGAKSRWSTLLFFVLWTIVAAAAVWWLLNGGSNRGDFLISLDRPEADSWAQKIRSWLEAHVEIYSVYAWVLLAPYVLWLALRVTLERRGIPWRIAFHLAFGAGFVSAAQALTDRLEAMRPRMVFLSKEEVVRFGDGSTNEPSGRVAWTRKFEVHRFRPDTNPPALLIGKTDPHRIVVVQAGAGGGIVGDGVIETNKHFQVALTNAAAHQFGSRLAPLIKRHIDAPPQEFLPPVRLTAALDSLAYFALVGLAQAIHFRRRLDEGEKQAALLESRLTQSRLHALQAQLQPHFLFNTLNGIATLVRRDPQVAEEMLASLSDLLRVSLAQAGRQEIPLREELDFLDRYLELQQMRFGDRLRIERQVEPAALDCLVPSFVLQPLVENAIRHGIEPSGRPGLVRIVAQRTEGEVCLSIEDDGGGLRGSKPAAGNGIGLHSVRERLDALYGTRHEFRIEERPSGGVAASMRIPGRCEEPQS